MKEVIEIKNLTYKWPGQKEELLDIHQLPIEKGNRVFLMGASGSGKSTLLNLLGGVLIPNRGEINVLNTSISALKTSERDKFRGDHFGFIFQQFNLVPYLSVIENVTLPCRFSEKRWQKSSENYGHPNFEAERLLDHLGLSGEKMRTKAVTELSVGQQQRVAAARALIGSPEILIADEPTSSLDANTQELFLELLFQECEAQNTTLVFVSHDERFSKLFHQTIHINSLKTKPVVGGAL